MARKSLNTSKPSTNASSRCASSSRQFRAIALRADGRFHQAVVRRLPVGADDPAPVEVVGVVLEVALARQEDAERERGIRRVRVAHLGGHRAAREDGDVLLVLGGADARIEAVVVLLVDERVLRRVGAEHVAAHAPREQRLRVLLQVQDAAAVGGPGEVGLDVLDPVRQQLAGREVLDPQRVLPAADRILGEREQVVVRRDRGGAHLEEAVALRHPVDVEHDLLGRVQRAGLARIDRVFLAGLVARVVPVAAQAVRHGRVVLLDAPDDLAVDLFLERIGVRRHRRLVGVLGLEVADHLGIGARVVAQPVVLVGAGTVRRLDDVGPDGCDRRHRRGLRHARGLRPGRRVARAGSEERRHDGQDQCVAEAVHRLVRILPEAVTSRAVASAAPSARPEIHAASARASRHQSPQNPMRDCGS